MTSFSTMAHVAQQSGMQLLRRGNRSPTSRSLLSTACALVKLLKTPCCAMAKQLQNATALQPTFVRNWLATQKLSACSRLVCSRQLCSLVDASATRPTASKLWAKFAKQCVKWAAALLPRVNSKKLSMCSWCLLLNSMSSACNQKSSPTFLPHVQ